MFVQCDRMRSHVAQTTIERFHNAILLRFQQGDGVPFAPGILTQARTA